MSDSHWSGGAGAMEGGRLRLWGPGAVLCRWFDREFLAMALDDGATECRFPATLGRDTLARAGYFEAFPGGASAVASADGGAAYYLPPAVCYHAYEWLRDASIGETLTLTAAQACFREADRDRGSAARLWEFTMREVVFVGPPEWVAERRRTWEARTAALARRAGLEGTLEPATDMFFGDAARGQRLLQQIKSLKTELRLTIANEQVAVASFNLHETFFSSRFGFRLAGGGAAHSACAAFGIERWALAFLDQRGPDAVAGLVAAR
jgi:seryl-tRNA synthetase